MSMQGARAVHMFNEKLLFRVNCLPTENFFYSPSQARGLMENESIVWPFNLPDEDGIKFLCGGEAESFSSSS